MAVHNHQFFKKSSLSVSVIVGVCMLFVFSLTALADAPVVCASGDGNVTVNNYNLVSQCSAPAGRPVYVELRLVSDGGLFSTSRVQLTEGAQTCDISTPLVADCAVTVRDGVLDFASVSNAQNYRLTFRWDSETASSTALTATNVFTIPLSSGDAAIIRREFDYGDIAIGGMIFFAVVVMLVAVINKQVSRR